MTFLAVHEMCTGLYMSGPRQCQRRCCVWSTSRAITITQWLLCAQHSRAAAVCV